MKDEKIIRRAFEIAEKEASGDGLFKAALKAEIAIHKAVELARRDERKQIVRWVEIKIKDILRDKDYYNQFYGADILVRTLKGIIDGIECCAWEDVDDSLFKKRVIHIFPCTAFNSINDTL